ncbi:unnamed protein product [Vitrella brassicaformis CCMP3155]|uniref:Uncharacterized protein n=1 Tax=Vitrella brassicaformis (strain CCMP3155) TaxID=1169540 RepID=A0A0G4EI74_VITBC|nr:unnamed protein product [Vitrella brassicaformis CCMP3155]|eukprot:CEL95703.1 unnamed protein product [Vitrella brassicaformis CCMP3155]
MGKQQKGKGAKRRAASPPANDDEEKEEKKHKMASQKDEDVPMTAREEHQKLKKWTWSPEIYDYERRRMTPAFAQRQGPFTWRGGGSGLTAPAASHCCKTGLKGGIGQLNDRRSAHQRLDRSVSRGGPGARTCHPPAARTRGRGSKRRSAPSVPHPSPHQLPVSSSLVSSAKAIALSQRVDVTATVLFFTGLRCMSYMTRKDFSPGLCVVLCGVAFSILTRVQGLHEITLVNTVMCLVSNMFIIVRDDITNPDHATTMGLELQFGYLRPIMNSKGLGLRVHVHLLPLFIRDDLLTVQKMLREVGEERATPLVLATFSRKWKKNRGGGCAGKWEQLHPMKVPSENEILAQVKANDNTPVGSQGGADSAAAPVRLRASDDRRVQQLVLYVPCADFAIVDSVGWEGFDSDAATLDD